MVEFIFNFSSNPDPCESTSFTEVRPGPSGVYLSPNQETASSSTTSNVDQTPVQNSKKILSKVCLPEGPWSQHLYGFPKSMSESLIGEYSVKGNAKRQYDRGYVYYKATKTRKLDLCYQEDYIFCDALVEGSYKVGEFHTSHLKLNASDGNICLAWCSCKAGACGYCSHVFCILWFLWDAVKSNQCFIKIDTRSCTEKPRAWGIAKSNSAKLTSKFYDLIFVKYRPGKVSKNIERIRKRKNFRKGIKAKLSHSNLCNLVEQLECHNVLDCLRESIVTFDCNPMPLPEIPEIEELETQDKNDSSHFLPKEILWQEEFSLIFSSNIDEYKFCNHTLAECHDLERLTREQSKSALWISKRQTILSASKFSKVIKRKKIVDDKFVKTLFSNKKFTTSSSFKNYMQIGLDNEGIATAKYLQVNKEYSCQECGLIINPGIPCLGASPDRVIKNNKGEIIGLLEIKTLSKMKSMNIPTIQEGMQLGMASFLQNEGGNLSLKKNSDHFFQVLGQLAVSGLPFCDVLVDGGREFFIERVSFDRTLWQQVLPKLLKFCSDHLKCN